MQKVGRGWTALHIDSCGLINFALNFYGTTLNVAIYNLADYTSSAEAARLITILIWSVS